MKRMSEVFRLPLSNSHEFIYEAGKEFDYCMASFDEYDQAKAAAAAINHVDALADALEFMIANNWCSSFNRKEAESKAKAALASYRGEK